MARTIDDELRRMLKEEADEMKQESNQPTTLLGRFFQEAGDDDSDEDDGESLEDIEKDMGNLDSDDDDNDDSDDNGDNSDDIGKDTSDVQNEYDEEELTTLNKLIADEQEAIQGYFDAAEKSKQDVLVRLYSDIGKEERFHTEQLLYAKAELTGEKYEPSDPEVKKEYEELLAGGMDEETAMYTIADKHQLDSEDNEELDEDLEEISKDIESIGEAFNMTIANYEMLMAIQESSAYKNHADLRNAYCEFAETVFVQEAMDNVATKQGSEILGTNNPFIIIGRMIKSIYTAILNMVKKLKNWVDKRRIKTKRTLAWIKKNGIKGIFANGVKLYFWNDQSGTVEVSDAVAFMHLCMNVTDWVANAIGVVPPRVTNGKAGGKAFSNSMGKSITFSNINDGMHKIDGVVFSKSKVIVTDNNEADLEQMFFGISGGTFITTQDDGKSYDVKSKNVYNAFQYILQWATEQLKATDEWLEKVAVPAAGRQRGISYAKPEVYKDCLAAMKSVSKGYTKLIKCLSADIETCMKLDQGLLNAVNAVDKQRDPNNPGAYAISDDSQALNSDKKPRVAGNLN